MPTINMAFTVSARVAALNKSAAERQLGKTLTAAQVTAWAIDKAREYFVGIAINERDSQNLRDDAADNRAIDSEVTMQR